VGDAIAAIDESYWELIDYNAAGLAEAAEPTYKGDRLVARRTCLVGH
jgi:hypothetical protein